jgi:hypothetical protein
MRKFAVSSLDESGSQQTGRIIRETGEELRRYIEGKKHWPDQHYQLSYIKNRLPAMEILLSRLRSFYNVKDKLPQFTEQIDKLYREYYDVVSEDIRQYKQMVETGVPSQIKSGSK